MSTATRKRSPRHSRKLGPEPWGSRMARARRAAGYSDTRALDDAKRHLGFGRGPIGDLERMEEVPTNPNDREKAYKLLVFYGFDPADFGLDDEDAPKVIDLTALRDLGESPTKWSARPAEVYQFPARHDAERRAA